MSNAPVKNIFENFTRKYPLSKTLRFELRVPQEFPNTQTMLEQENIIEADKLRREKYEKVKPWIDRMHREFIKDALADFSFNDLTAHDKAFKAWKKDKKSKEIQKILNKTEADLRKEIVNYFDKTAGEWVKKYPELKLKKVDSGIFFEAGVFDVLAERYKDEKDTFIITADGKEANIFKDWKNWTGYFDKFFQTRKNFYSDKEESTAIAYRIVNQNLRRFHENIDLYTQIKGKIDIKQIEKDLDISSEKIFTLDYYSKCLLQEGIDRYNLVLGGYVDKESDSKIPGINQAINEYRQRNKNDKVRILSMLDKQIHSEKDIFIDEIKNDDNLLEHLHKFIHASDQKLNAFHSLLENTIQSPEGYDLDKIYISSTAFEHNAGRWFGDYSTLERSLVEIAKDKKWKESYTLIGQRQFKEEDGGMKYPDFLILGHIGQAMDNIPTNIWNEKYIKKIAGFSSLSSSQKLLAVIKSETDHLFLDIDNDDAKRGFISYKKELSAWIESNPVTIDEDKKILIKNFADTSLTLYQIAKYFAVEKKRQWLDYFDLDSRFYDNTDNGYRYVFYGAKEDISDAYTEIVKGYNTLRNYLTKKPYNTDKWLLNFKNPKLADGWDKNKEKDNSAVIFRKDGRYFLGIMHKDHCNLFLEKNRDAYAGTGFEKMEYKYFPEASKMIPKCSTQLQKVCEHFQKTDNDIVLQDKKMFSKPIIISRRIYDLNNVYYRKDDINTSFIPNSKSKKEDGVKQFQKEYLKLANDKSIYFSALKDWIAFCITFLQAYESTSLFDFSKLQKPEKYSSLDEFYKDVNSITYSHIFTQISEKYLKEKNDAGELFIFGIHNKDWNLKDGKKKKGTKNLHTLYWENLFSDENLKEDYVFKLNGEAELFFRKKTEEKNLGHKSKGRDGKWKRIAQETEKDNGKKVVDHWRYAHDKIFFHCPITLNRVSDNTTEFGMNAEIREALSQDSDVNIIGIDRGEKHLAYYSVIDKDGAIIETRSFNIAGESDNKNVDYAKILDARAKERESARRDWKTVEQIKDTKRGYVSQVVREIADLAIKHNAIIVLEDLNMRFKQTRGGIEKSIYQQLEKQLIDKLSFLASKNEMDQSKPGHPMRAYQLASPISSFKDMGKQTGIIFYTAAGYTSRTCPECGYRRNIRFEYRSIGQAEEIISKLEDFSYDRKNDCFVLSYSLKRLLNPEQLKKTKGENKLYEDEDHKDIFTITTKDAARYKWMLNQSPRLKALIGSKGVEDEQGEDESQTRRGKTKRFIMTSFIKGALEDAGISLESKNLQQAVIDAKDKNIYEKLFFAFFLLTETRQTISGKDIDYIHCPHCGFDSRNKFQEKEFNGDANGAYNIARKGIMVLKKIEQYKKKNSSVEKMKWGELSVSIEEWDKFTQNPRQC